MLEMLKDEVCGVAKKAQSAGLCQHRAGNFSALDSESGNIVITPSGIDRDKLAPCDLIVTTRDARIIENISKLKPSSETLMHLAIYKTRSDARSVAHTHSLYATTFAVLNRPIPAIVYEAAMLGLTNARIPVAQYFRPGTAELAQSVVETCKESECFLMEKHGAVAFDSGDISEAYLKASFMEEIAHLYYNTLTLTKGLEPACISQRELSEWRYPEQISIDA